MGGKADFLGGIEKFWNRAEKAPAADVGRYKGGSNPRGRGKRRPYKGKSGPRAQPGMAVPQGGDAMSFGWCGWLWNWV